MPFELAESSGIMPHGQKVMLFVIGWIDDLVTRGLMISDQHLTDKGREDYQALKATNFAPTDEEFTQAFAALAESES